MCGMPVCPQCWQWTSSAKGRAATPLPAEKKRIAERIAPPHLAHRADSGGRDAFRPGVPRGVGLGGTGAGPCSVLSWSTS